MYFGYDILESSGTCIGYDIPGYSDTWFAEMVRKYFRHDISGYFGKFPLHETTKNKDFDFLHILKCTLSCKNSLLYDIQKCQTPVYSEAWFLLDIILNILYDKFQHIS